jgi:transcriptional regulator with XRE-family HTH domain
MKEKTTFGKFIAAKRKERGLTQVELAQQLYVTESAVSKWERGISYPDITLVTAICSALGISEHELITASDDVHQRQIEIQAEKYRRLRKRYLCAFNIIYGITLLTCFICNFVMVHALTWFFIAVAACMMMFSLTSLPLLVPKKKGLVTLGAFFLTLNLLLLTCCVYTSGDWFFVSFTALTFAFSVVFAPYVLRNIVLPEKFSQHKALLSMSADTLLLFLILTAVSIRENNLFGLFYPLGAMTLYWLILPWSFLLVIRYLKISAMFRTSICLTIGGLHILTVGGVSDAITGQKPFVLPPIDLSNWNWQYLNGNFLAATTLVCLAAALLFAFGGMLSSVRKSSPQAEADQAK